MPKNTFFKMFFKHLFTCFFITWILATCFIVSRWRGWSLCKLFHSYYESLFMSMNDKQTKCSGCVTSHSQQIGQPPCLALTDLWTGKQCLKYFTSGNKKWECSFPLKEIYLKPTRSKISQCFYHAQQGYFNCTFLPVFKYTGFLLRTETWEINH